MQCVRVKGNGSPPYGLYGGKERKYLTFRLPCNVIYSYNKTN